MGSQLGGRDPKRVTDLGRIHKKRLKVVPNLSIGENLKNSGCASPTFRTPKCLL